MQSTAQLKGMGRRAWKSHRMGETRSSALTRVIRAGQAALATPDSSTGDTSGARASTERTSAQDPGWASTERTSAQDPGWASTECTSPRDPGWASTSAQDPGSAPTVVVRRPVGRGRPPGPDPILGRYRLIRRLGAGGFGTVWLAWDERLEREVALKLLVRERVASGRFEREARVAARLNHPGIVVLYEAAVDDEGAYLVSELVRGQTVARLLQDGSLSDQDVVRVAIALCDALDYAHGQGVIHRDVKPSNVLMPDAPASSAGVAKLTDFGVARLVGGDSLTRTGDVVGTTAYMAPEQAEGREVDASADLYSLALVTYEALTGLNPVRLSVPAARGGRRLGTYLPAVRRHRRDLPRELACAIDLALRPRQRERGTVGELREALTVALPQVDDEPGVVEPHGSASPPPDSSREALWAPPAYGSPRDTRTLPAMGQGEWSVRSTPRFAQSTPRLARSTPRPPQSTPRPARPRWTPAARLLAAGAGAAATAWFTGGVLTPSPVLPAMAVLLTGLVVAALPRAGWLGLCAVGAGLLLEQGSAGGALVLTVAVVLTAASLLRAPTRWALPASVPALVLAGLGGAWPALAGRAGAAWQRLILGAAGWVWLVVGAFLTGQAGYLQLPSATPSPQIWMPSLYDTVHQVLSPLLSSGVLAPALVWGGGALVLPWITSRPLRGRQPGAWIARGVLLLAWATGLALLTHGLLATLAPGVRMRSGVVILGVFACAAAAGLPRPAALRRSLGDAPTPGQDSRSMETR